MKITVLGDGAWGTTLALHLLGLGHEVTLWGTFPEYIQEMAQKRENPAYLPEVSLPDSLMLENDLPRAVNNAEIIVLAIPSQFLRKSLQGGPNTDFTNSSTIFVNVAKGIEVESCKRPSQIVAEELGKVNYAALSGPSHAEEVAFGKPAAVVCASNHAAISERIQQLFMNEQVRVYNSDDVIGVELGGSLKNVYAIAAGICDGLEAGDSAKAALLTRGIAELSRLGVQLGGKENTFPGLSGTGDIVVTCCSGHSRNRYVGEQLGKGRTVDEIENELGRVTAEGIKTTSSAYKLACEAGVDTPIIAGTYQSLYEGKPPKEVAKDLMMRPPKRE